ncbi:MAG: hypothetical protein K2O67_00430, partial [Clostridia bacterium]|nr:hypothetical protein [Clostridia bacterium]
YYSTSVEHTPGAAATCTKSQTCTVCGTQLVASLGHEWNDWHTTKPATEDEPGEEQRECQRTNCGEIETQPIPQLNHTHKFAEGWTSDETNHWHASTCGHNVKDGEEEHIWDDGEITKEATCTAEGVKTFTCTVCAKTKTEAVDKIAHTSSDWIEDKAPTCTAAGSKHKECTVCHTSLETGTIDKIAHTPGDAANCTTAQTCTACGTELAPKLGHNYEAAEGGVVPTCTEAGSGKLVCSCCDDEKEGDSIPALGHVEVVDEAVAPTCTDTGLTEGKHCSRCEEVLTAQTEIPALGHDWSTVWSNDETNHWHECNRCDEKNGETAHTYEWIITKDPTEEETGLKENLCTVCGDKDGEEELAKLVVDDKGSVGDLPVLPPNQDYDLEIAVKESESKYNIEGLNKGYLVELFIV